MSTTWSEYTQRVANGIRRRVLDFTIRNNGGYLSQACSAAEILATLYTRVMRIGESCAPRIPPPFPGVPSKTNPHYFSGAAYNGPYKPELDRFFISPVHCALALYALLVEVGRMDAQGLEMFNKDGSTVEMIGAEHSPGHELMAGSLGQALSQAAGIALARRLKGHTGRNWVFMSDGEFWIGQTWEAVETLVFYKLDTVGVYIDANGQSADGKIETVMEIGSIRDRLAAFGVRVFEVDGHDVEALAAPAELPPDGRPLFIIARTNPCQGIPLLEERRPRLHYVRFKDEAEKQRYREFLMTMNGGIHGA
ncbi:transketolase [Chloroflexus sp. Y-396-1]|uniref:transketolase n=1 Tax=Chloroflexus sp. Y-396-1 TaxID=867845 RepID=UPI00049124B9|nr:transketolase [Chloroflexus sp. Y-396-1]